MDTSYAVEGFGEAKPARDLLFLVVVAGEASNHYQKGEFLGGSATLQTSRRR